MQLSDITWQGVISAVGIILVAIGVWSTVMAARKTAREEQERREAPLLELTRRVDAHDASIEECRRQVDKLTRKEEANDQVTKLMLRGMLALVRHGVDGNNIEDLKTTQGEIQEYLINR